MLRTKNYVFLRRYEECGAALSKFNVELFIFVSYCSITRVYVEEFFFVERFSKVCK